MFDINQYDRRRRRSRIGLGLGAVAISVAVVAAISVPIVSIFYVQEHTRVTIQHRERVLDGEGSRYMIYTDAGVMQNTDSLLDFKFNSADVYAMMMPGSTCDLITRGFRVPLFSMFPNIVEAQCS